MVSKFAVFQLENMISTRIMSLSFYLNTTDYQPLLADIWALEKIEMPSFQTLWKHLLGNIINLRVVRIGYDATTGRALLDLNSDIRYVLEHTDKYIRPLQDKGA